ncbi:hypothetical protein ACX801_18035 [Arthrobacter bambusae]
MHTKTQSREPGLAAAGFSPAPPPGDVRDRPEGFFLYPGPVRKVFEAIAGAADQDGILAGKPLRDIAQDTGLPLTVAGMAVRVLDRDGRLMHFFDLEGRSVWVLPDVDEQNTVPGMNSVRGRRSMERGDHDDR